ncbi:MAG: MBOAT, membrane-bound O-acyltransferase family-domain-containing protein [Benjaminiella poitrasii]|nr:MAG: MBOAT, membrane-bound O-acyltransferase family-domain-containing protein [Benjaminiella poitrasii]
MDAFFEQASAKMGGNPTAEQLKIVASILSAYPCAVLFRLIPAQQILMKHLFSICITSYIMTAVLHSYTGFMHVAISCLFTYLFMKYYKGKNGPWINFAVIMLSMSYCHLYRQFIGFDVDGSNDYSGALMIATIKLTSFGFNVADGRTKDQSTLSSYNQRMKIERYPTLIEFYGWMFFFGGFLVGPTSEFMDYMRFVTMQMFEVKGKTKIPYALNQTLFLIGKSLIFVAAIVFITPKFSSTKIDSDEWRSLSFTNKLIYLQVAAFTSRCKYYVAWFLSEGASVLCGFGFNGFGADGKPRWDRFTNLYVFKCELAQSIKEMIDHWNMGANRWLRYYVYLRVTPPGQTGGAMSALTTYAVSAIWHGFYPGYYLFFLSVTPFQMLARNLRRTFRPLVFVPGTKTPKPVLKFFYDVAGCIVAMSIINFLSVAFNLLYWKPVVRAWAQIYYIHYVVGFAGYVLWRMCSPTFRQYQKKREANAIADRSRPPTPPVEEKTK